MWLTQYPQPRPPRDTGESDPIFSAMQQAFSAHHVESPDFMGIHYMDATTVEECWRLLRQTGKSNSYEALANVPRYSAWLQQQDWTDAYARHQGEPAAGRPQRPGEALGAEEPSHTTALDALMAVTRTRWSSTPIATPWSASPRPARCRPRRRPATPRRTSAVRSARPSSTCGPGRSTPSTTRARGTTRAVRRHRVLGAASGPARGRAASRRVRADWTPEVEAAITDLDRESRQGKAAPSHTYSLEDYGSTEGRGPGGLRPMRSGMKKRVVVWGTGGRVDGDRDPRPPGVRSGVGVTRSGASGQDVGTLLGLPETGVITTTSVEELVALRPDAPSTTARPRSTPTTTSG